MQHSEKCDYSSAHRDSGGDPDDAGCCRFFVGPVGAHYFHCFSHLSGQACRGLRARANASAAIVWKEMLIWLSLEVCLCVE